MCVCRVCVCVCLSVFLCVCVCGDSANYKLEDTARNISAFPILFAYVSNACLNDLEIKT